MKRKINSLQDFKHTPNMPEVLKKKTAEETGAEVLTAIRQLEPEEQNEVIKTLLAELAIDRHNSVRQFGEARDRAAKNMDTFMMYAMGIEKLLATAMEKR